MPANNADFFSGSDAPVYSGPGLAGKVGSWQDFAIGDNGSLKGNEPGLKWGRYTALIPVSQLVHYREYNRKSYSQRLSDSSDRINEIAQDLTEKNPNAFREHVHLVYDHARKWAYLSEGNHRLAAAIQAGVTHIPVTVSARGNCEDEQRRGVGAPLHMDVRLHEEATGYHPSSIHPGNFQEFEGTR